jgi:hypothetical protein
LVYAFKFRDNIQENLLILLNASNTYKMGAFRIIAKGLSFINLSKNIELKKRSAVESTM